MPAKLTVDDYMRLPDDGIRYELIDGNLYVTAAPNRRHQRLVLRLAVAFHVYLLEHGGGEAFIAPFDVVMSQIDVVQPDVVFVADAHMDILTELRIEGRPTLCIEVVSDPRRDRVLKRERYAVLGVNEYWIVDPSREQIEVLRRSTRYEDPDVLQAGDTLRYAILPGFSLDVSELFRGA